MSNINNKIEPVWTYQAKLKKLDEKLDQTQIILEDKIEKSQSFTMNAISYVKRDVVKDISPQIEEIKQLKESVESRLASTLKNLQEDASTMKKSLWADVNAAKSIFQKQLNDYDKEHNSKIIQVFNSLEATNKKLDRIKFDVIDNENNISITYINPLGKTEYAAIKKSLPDEKTLAWDQNKKLTLKYRFDPTDFQINEKTSIITSRGMTLSSGKHLTADRINNDLSNATYNISNLTFKLEQLIQKLNSSNGYMASNDFKTDFPDQESLTEFALSCISQNNPSIEKITKDHLPNGTKIKNTYNNHIWVFNRIYVGGLTTSKWEDFGSDSICIANNEGVHGLVAGSQEKYKGYVDIHGEISINGLEEELQEILEGMLNVNSNLTQYKSETDAKLADFENRLYRLELKENG